MTEQQEKRLALIPALAQGTSKHQIGRTALMKFMYFLQTLRGVPLGYRFTLYSYGPFDSTVLADLSVAESLRAVESRTVIYSGGYGYEITAGDKAKWLKKRAQKFVDQHEKDIRWVLQKFGTLTSSQLELVSTIIYVDREAAEKNQTPRLKSLAGQVHEIKPHFSETEILGFAESLAKDKLLLAAH
ncbi:MAG TPA: hypothetical protein VJ723_08080 [Candidatus Angelobacter sp.]|nr:hypothetical protein [Candidatus Angelobacter sp.]